LLARNLHVESQTSNWLKLPQSQLPILNMIGEK